LIAPDDIRNAKRAGGYEHIQRHGGPQKPGGKPRDQWCAILKTERGSNGSRIKARGPRRNSPLEAAQDYCDYANGNALPVSTALISAGHTATRDSLPRDPEVEHALGVLRDAKGAREGNQGYVYCIVEEAGPGTGTPQSTAADPKHPSGYVFGPFCKIGFSTNPEARVAELQTGNPRKLVLLGKIEGTVEDEAAMHQRYIFHNVLQEWFVLTPMIRYEFTKTGTVTGRFSAAVPSDATDKVA
jgi:hypothetical protein